MKNRTRVIYDQRTMNDSGTFTMNIDVKDPVSALILQLEAANGATHNKTSPLWRCISKIELLDGSDVLYSLSGSMARALAAHLHGSPVNDWTTELGGDSPYADIVIPFGRHLWDTQYAFHPLAHLNPQLKITWDLAAVNAVGATGYVTGSLKYSVVAKVMEEIDNPAGFLMAKNFYDWTTAASGDERIDMPVDYPYRYLFIRAFEAQQDMRNNITNLKLHGDEGKDVVFDYRTRFVISDMFNTMPIIEQHSQLVGDEGDYKQTYIGMSCGGNISARTKSRIVGAHYFWLNGILLRAVTDAGADASGCVANVVDRGTAYEACYVLPMGNPDEPDSWLDTTRFNSLKLYCTQGNAGADASVAIQQARSYTGTVR